MEISVYSVVSCSKKIVVETTSNPSVFGCSDQINKHLNLVHGPGAIGKLVGLDAQSLEHRDK